MLYDAHTHGLRNREVMAAIVCAFEVRVSVYLHDIMAIIVHLREVVCQASCRFFFHRVQLMLCSVGAGAGRARTVALDIDFV